MYVSNCFIQYIEHVQVVVNAETNMKRGNLEIYIVSPSGTESELLSTRQNDDGKTITYFTFMSVLMWGEGANGEWVLRVVDTSDNESKKQLPVAHGVKINPRY